ncbi:MAG: glycine cleavage system protein GcvH [Planctomycetota bacterium]|nr:glycine cleavage system protein GcvH [Planctomycetota bacterium]
MKPEELFYSQTHEWVALQEQDGIKIATVGISAFAVEALTDLVFLELPQVGAQVVASEAFGEIESVKAVSDLYSPVTGEVIEVNEKLPDNLEVLSENPYQPGWIAKIRITDESSLAELIEHDAYQKMCAEEEV